MHLAYFCLKEANPDHCVYMYDYNKVSIKFMLLKINLREPVSRYTAQTRMNQHETV